MSSLAMLAALVFRYCVDKQKDRQTYHVEKQNTSENPIPMTAVGVGN